MISAARVWHCIRGKYDNTDGYADFSRSPGKWPVILQMLRIDVPENGRHGPCPKCGGKDRFRLDDLDGRGTWICSQCGNGDGLDLVKLMTGYGVRKAAQEVAQVLNVPDVQELPVKPARQKAPKRDMSLTVAALMKESHTGETPI